MEAEGASPEEFERIGTGKLRAAAVDGDVDFGSVMAGQIAGLVNKHQSAAEIMEEIISDAEATIRNMYGRIH